MFVATTGNHCDCVRIVENDRPLTGCSCKPGGQFLLCFPLSGRRPNGSAQSWMRV